MRAELCRNYLHTVYAVLDTNVANIANVALKLCFKHSRGVKTKQKNTVYNTNVANVAKKKA